MIDHLSIRHIASGIQAEIYTFAYPDSSAPATSDDEDDLVRLLETVDIRRDAPPSQQITYTQAFGIALVDVDDGRAGDVAGAGNRIRALKVVSAGRDGWMPRLRPHNIATEVHILRRIKHPNVSAIA